MPGAFIRYKSASIGKIISAKIVLFDSPANEKWGSGGLPPEKSLRQRPLERRKTPFCKVKYSCVHHRSSCEGGETRS